MKRLLLDTHLMLWWLGGDRRLGASSRRLMEGAQCAVSVISIAEVELKAAAGKLRFPGPRIDAMLESANIGILPLTLADVRAAARLMGHHPDPFDCLLVGTALAESLVLATRDAALLANAAGLLGKSILEV